VGTPQLDVHPMAAADPVLAPLVRGAAVDPETLGVVLSGSRGAGLGDADSDYDVVFVLTEAARVDVRAWFDAYLNAFYRSLKASRRGDELGARLHASSSLACLVQALFRLERRWPPYHDYLAPQLDTLAE
jgi:hypothetical protein